MSNHMYSSKKLVDFANVIMPTLTKDYQMDLQKAIDFSGMDSGKSILELYKEWFTLSFVDRTFRD